MIRRLPRLTLLSLLYAGMALLVNPATTQAAPQAVITVTTAADNNVNDSECSLREAILAANTDSAVGGCAAGSDADTIEFAIPGAGPHIIQLLTALPAISDSVIIDGYSQPGAQANTNPAPQALNTVLQIMLDGSQITPPIAPGLNLIGGDVEIRGLAIGNFADGIVIAGASSSSIAGNFIGTNISGTVAAGNAGNGIAITTPGVTIGYGFESEPAARNLIAGNGANGVSIVGPAASFNEVRGNLIGTNISATLPLSNTASGIAILDEAIFNDVYDNVIAANGAWGIRIENGAADTTIANNYIGTNGAGDDLGNGEDGILARNSGPQTIGGTYNVAGCCVGNTIAFNAGNGVTIRADISVSLEKGILSNRIYANGGLGIDLRDDGVTLNDPGDADGENDANHLQNFPVLSAATIISPDITITGTLNTITNTNYRVEFYANDACDPSGYGEGQRYLGGTRLTTDEAGNADFAVTLTQTAPSLVQVGNAITAIASDPAGNTSEFSQCITATGEGAGETFENQFFMPSLWGKLDDER